MAYGRGNFHIGFTVSGGSYCNIQDYYRNVRVYCDKTGTITKAGGGTV